MVFRTTASDESVDANADVAAGGAVRQQVMSLSMCMWLQEGLFDSKEACVAGIGAIEGGPHPDHMLWFEYNFLYVLVAGLGLGSGCCALNAKSSLIMALPCWNHVHILCWYVQNACRTILVPCLRGSVSTKTCIETPPCMMPPVESCIEIHFPSFMCTRLHPPGSVLEPTQLGLQGARTQYVGLALRVH